MSDTTDDKLTRLQGQANWRLKAGWYYALGYARAHNDAIRAGFKAKVLDSCSHADAFVDYLEGLDELELNHSTIGDHFQKWMTP